MNIRQTIAAAFLLLAGTASAQQMPPVPTDPAVRLGQLDNGLTYYIRHNTYPENVVNFYIAQRVGSINEDDDQRGLAHLLEHMAFNGSEHFPGNSVQEYLQSIGVEYGRNLNAYTSTDQTVYFITDVPSARVSALDSCLLVLKDWSNGLTLDAKAIDEERDIVHNEYRMRIVGTQKILETAMPRLYEGSKYGQRYPIGLMEVIDGCNPETLRAYYRKWYRPDNQAIIVVGDIDVDRTEQQIQSLFGGTTVPAGAAQVEPYPVPDNNQAIYVTGKDKEQQVSLIEVFMKRDATPAEEKATMGHLAENYLLEVVASMLGARLDEISQSPESPFLQANVDNGMYLMSRTKDSFSTLVLPKEGQELQALAAAVRELRRAREFGFTASEYERAKAKYLTRLESLYNNREKQPNNYFCQQYVDHFINQEPIPAIDLQYQVAQQMAPMIPVEAVNEVAKAVICASDTNLVVLAMQPEKEGTVYLNEDDMRKTVDAVRTETLTAYEDNAVDEPLMASLPKKGKIVKETVNEALGFTTLTLSNGAKVVLKKTDFNNDEILLKAEAAGGASVFTPQDLPTLQLAGELLGQTGLGQFSKTDLTKVLAGKKCSTDFSIEATRHALNGSTTPKDLETLMQLVYLNFTNLSKDSQAGQNIMNTLDLLLKNIGANNEVVFTDSVQSTLFLGNDFYRVPQYKNLPLISYDRAVEMAKTLFGNAAAFTFTFVGNFDEAQMRQFVEQYIASLPGKKGKALKAKDLRTYAQGAVANHFTRPMENPQAQANTVWRSDAVPFTLENLVYTDAAARLLDMDYNRVIREQMSAAYHAGAESECDDDGPALYLLVKAIAKLNPEKAAQAMAYQQEGMAKTVQEPNADDLQKVKQILLKKADEDAKTNKNWIRVLNIYNRNGIDVQTGLKETILSITPQRLAAFLKGTILASGHQAEVTMQPEAK